MKQRKKNILKRLFPVSTSRMFDSDNVSVGIRNNYCYSCCKYFKTYESFISHHHPPLVDNTISSDMSSEGHSITDDKRDDVKPFTSASTQHTIVDSQNQVTIPLSSTVRDQRDNSNLDDDGQEGCFESEHEIRVQCLECKTTFVNLKSLWAHLKKRKRVKGMELQDGSSTSRNFEVSLSMQPQKNSLVSTQSKPRDISLVSIQPRPINVSFIPIQPKPKNYSAPVQPKFNPTRQPKSKNSRRSVQSKPTNVVTPQIQSKPKSISVAPIQPNLSNITFAPIRPKPTNVSIPPNANFFLVQPSNSQSPLVYPLRFCLPTPSAATTTTSSTITTTTLVTTMPTTKTTVGNHADKLKELKKNLSDSKSIHCTKCPTKFTTQENLDHHTRLVHVNSVDEDSCSTVRAEADTLSHSQPLSPPTATVPASVGSPAIIPAAVAEDDDFDNPLEVPNDSPPDNADSDIEEIQMDPDYSGTLTKKRKKSDNLVTIQIIAVDTMAKKSVPSKNYNCSCGKVFSYRFVRDKHAVRAGHDIPLENNYKCRVCPSESSSTFAKRPLLVKHMMAAHPNEKLLKCTIFNCDKSYWDLSALKRHIFYQHKIRQEYHCTKCSKSFNSLNVYRFHLKSHQEPETEKPIKPPVGYSCPICPQNDDLPQFKSKPLLIQHFTSNHPEQKLFNCSHPDCDKSYWDKYKLEQHTLGAHGDPSEYPHKCEFPDCDKKFLYKSQLVVHGHEHTGESPFLCPTCGARFNSNKSCRAHMRAHEDTFQCHKCPKTFNMRCNLQRHLKLHEGIKRFLCSVCAKTFGQKVQLESHMAYHSDEILHCPVEGCHRTFRVMYLLKIHLRKAHGDPSVVHVKRRKNSYSQRKRKDPKTSAQDQNVPCSECGKVFLGHHRLNIHVSKIHGNPQLPCPNPNCDMMLATRYSLANHIKFHEKNPPGIQFICTICEKEFNAQRFLTRHLNLMHGMNKSKSKSKTKTIKEAADA